MLRGDEIGSSVQQPSQRKYVPVEIILYKPETCGLLYHDEGTRRRNKGLRGTSKRVLQRLGLQHSAQLRDKQYGNSSVVRSTAPQAEPLPSSVAAGGTSTFTTQ